MELVVCQSASSASALPMPQCVVIVALGGARRVLLALRGEADTAAESNIARRMSWLLASRLQQSTGAETGGYARTCHL